MGIEEDESKAPKAVSFAVITVSDTLADSDDKSGRIIEDLLTSSGHTFVRKVVVKNDAEQIRRALREMIEEISVHAIVVNGGTGVAKADVTLEAISHFEEKGLPGFGELLRMLGHQQIGSTAMMLRASAFVSEGKPVFCIPGSEEAVRLAVTKLIAPELGHLVREASR